MPGSPPHDPLKKSVSERSGISAAPSAAASQGVKSARTKHTRRSSQQSAATSTAFGDATRTQSFKMLLLSRLGVKTDTTNYLAFNLRFFPMKFTDPAMEVKFFQLIHRLYPLRMVVLGPLALGLNIILWAMMGGKLVIMEYYLAKSKDHWPVFEPSQKFGFHAMQALNCFCYLLVGISPYLPVFNMNLEFTAYIFLSLSTLGTMVMCVWGVSLAPIDGVDLTVMVDGSLLDMLWQIEKLPLLWTAPMFKLWCDSFLNLCAFGLTLAVDVFLPTRTRFSCLFHGVIICSCCGVLLATSILLGSAYNAQPALGLQGICLAAIVLLGYVGRYFAELCDRAAGYEHIQNVERLEDLEAEVKSSSKSKSSTGVEDLVRILKKSQGHFANVRLGKAEEFGKAEDMLKSALQLLCRTQDLNAVRFAPEEDKLNQKFMYMFSRTAPELTEKQKEKRKEQKFVRYTPLGPIDTGPSVPARCMAAELFGAAGTDWGLDILKLSKDTKCILTEVGVALLENYASCMWTTSEVLLQFLWQLEKFYAPNPYHNSTHGAAVAHMTTCLANFVGLFNSEAVESIEIPCVIIAALAHDAGHPGRNNGFFVKTSHPLAMLYNDLSPLEHLHSCFIFRVLGIESANVFSAVDEPTYRTCRESIINTILATDMRLHFEQLSLFRVRRGAPDYDFISNRGDFWLTASILVKTADLGHTALDWLSHNEWSARITEEFYQQGEEETKLGCSEITPLCERSRHKDYAKSQKGFIEYVVQPLFKEIEEIDPSGQCGVECVRRLVYNRYKWEERAKSGEAVPIPESVRQCKTANALPTLCAHIESLISGSKVKQPTAAAAGNTFSPTQARVKFEAPPAAAPAHKEKAKPKKKISTSTEEAEEEEEDDDEYEYYEDDEEEDEEEEEEEEEDDARLDVDDESEF